MPALNSFYPAPDQRDSRIARLRAFLAAQPGLYEPADDNVRLRVRDGLLDLRSLDRPGFASGANPEWPTLQPLQLPAR